MSKRVYIATVGSSKEPILRGALYARPDIAYLLHGKDPSMEDRNPEKVAEFVRDVLRQIGIQTCELKYIDPFSLESVMTEFIKIWNNHSGDHIIANMTGGTNIMAAGCLVAGFVASAEVIYVRQLQPHEDVSLREQVITLPTPTLPLYQLHEQQKEILRLLCPESNKTPTRLRRATSIIADKLGLSPQTVSHHLAKLEKHGLLERKREGRVVHVVLTSAGLLYARMLV